MRSLVISAISLFLILAVWFGFMTYCEDSLNALTEQIVSEIEPAVTAGEWDTAAAEYDQLSRSWHANQAVYTLFFTHSEVVEAELAIARTEAFLRVQDASGAMAELAAAREHLKFLFENERINLANII